MLKSAFRKAALCGFCIAITLIGLVLSGGCASSGPEPSEPSKTVVETAGERTDEGQTDDESVAVDTSSAVEWSIQSDCSSCHADEAASMQIAECQVNGGHADFDCTLCHSDEASMSAAHLNASADAVKSNTGGTNGACVPNEVCLSCHEDDYTQVAQGDVVLTDRKGNTANPHALPSNRYHDALSCGDCHSMHSSKSIEETALANCTGCHHENVFRCGTCHDQPADI